MQYKEYIDYPPDNPPLIHNGNWIRPIKSRRCSKCYFTDTHHSDSVSKAICDYTHKCSPRYRNDNKNIIYQYCGKSANVHDYNQVVIQYLGDMYDLQSYIQIWSLPFTERFCSVGLEIEDWIYLGNDGKSWKKYSLDTKAEFLSYDYVRKIQKDILQFGKTKNKEHHKNIAVHYHGDKEGLQTFIDSWSIDGVTEYYLNIDNIFLCDWVFLDPYGRGWHIMKHSDIHKFDDLCMSKNKKLEIDFESCRKKDREIPKVIGEEHLTKSVCHGNVLNHIAKEENVVITVEPVKPPEVRIRIIRALGQWQGETGKRIPSAILMSNTWYNELMANCFILSPHAPHFNGIKIIRTDDIEGITILS